VTGGGRGNRFKIHILALKSGLTGWGGRGTVKLIMFEFPFPKSAGGFIQKLAVQVREKRQKWVQGAYGQVTREKRG